MTNIYPMPAWIGTPTRKPIVVVPAHLIPADSPLAIAAAELTNAHDTLDAAEEAFYAVETAEEDYRDALKDAATEGKKLPAIVPDDVWKIRYSKADAAGRNAQVSVRAAVKAYDAAVIASRHALAALLAPLLSDSIMDAGITMESFQAKLTAAASLAALAGFLSGHPTRWISMALDSELTHPVYGRVPSPNRVDMALRVRLQNAQDAADKLAKLAPKVEGN